MTHNYGLAIMLIPLLIGVVLSQALRLNLRGFLGIYLILVAGNMALSYLQLGAGYIAPLIIGAIGLVVTVTLTGFFGNRIRISDYALASFGIGLFPWNVGLLASIIYAIVFIGFAILIALKPKFKNPLRRGYRS